jgi:hypothetical protein
MISNIFVLEFFGQVDEAALPEAVEEPARTFFTPASPWPRD